jgi:hypothetical protein
MKTANSVSTPTRNPKSSAEESSLASEGATAVDIGEGSDVVVDMFLDVNDAQESIPS